VQEYLEEIRNEGVDTLILGCTHYPLLAKVVEEYMGENVKLISPGEEVAKYLDTMLEADMRHSKERDPEQYRYFVSDNIENFEELGSIFLETKINGQVTKIDIEKY